MVLIKTVFSRKKPKLKKRLEISQNGEMINISGFLSNQNYEVKKLMLMSTEDGSRIELDNKEKNNYFNFPIKLTDYKNLFGKIEDIYNLYLIVKVHEEQLTEQQKIKLKQKETTVYNEQTKYFEYPIRLGRFEETVTVSLNPALIDGVRYQLYKTIKGNVSLAVNKIVKQSVKTEIKYLKSKKNELVIGGNIFSRNHEIEDIKLVVIGRDNKVEEHYSEVSLKYLKKESIKKFGLNRYNFKVTFNLNDLSQNDLFNEDVYDLFFKIKFLHLDEDEMIRIGRPRFRARNNIKFIYTTKNGKVFVATPYYTFRLFNLSLQVDCFEKEEFFYLKRVMRWSFFYRLFNRNKKVWIVGERPYKAQDTGYHFFKYVREKYPNKNIYYVIEKDSPELKNVEPYGNVLFYKSKQHIKNVLIAERIIGSHHPDYLYPLRTKQFDKKVKAKKIFLQHGVMGTKNMVANYGKNAPSFSTDLFLVSSQFEREMIINDFGYDPDEVVITGLSRFDSLFKDDVKTRRQLLIIPTWREWLVRDDQFLESEYYERYKELIYNKELHQLAKTYNFEILFCLHPNMQKFTHFFNGAPVRVINQGEVDVQFLLKQSSIMVTDYSSVAFDFSFLNKPIIYYQFDRERFIGKRGSHLDLNNDLPGDIVFELNQLIEKVKNYAENNFQMKEENKQKAAKFIKYKDQNSCERIFQAIQTKVPKKTFMQKVENNELYNTLFKIFRRSKYYFPTMKLFYNFARKFIPVDKNLILFESGIGKQYADSPRYIYEEIVKQNLNYKKIWVCNKNIRFKDVENTKRIQRLSPSYYYYLARAGYWVNNQNFPTYIKKPENTIYLQTWHGTPLKKMLHDIENVMGRTDDYVDRVTQAIKNWDYLISPSAYATKAFRSAFKYEGKVLEIGYPRNDIFYHENKDKIKCSIKNRLNIPESKKIILYAPTFRDYQATTINRFTFDLRMDLEKMKAELGEDYILLLRMHVIIKNKINLDEAIKDFAFDVSDYPDVQELLLITDILITDYSSVMFDFANTRNPMLFYTYDLELYRDKVRGFYMDFEKEAPGPFVRNTEEIIDAIQNIEIIKKQYLDKYKQFYEKYCYLEDGKASERVVKLLFAQKDNN